MEGVLAKLAGGTTFNGRIGEGMIPRMEMPNRRILSMDALLINGTGSDAMAGAGNEIP